MEWKLRALDDQGNPIEPKQEEVQEQPVAEVQQEEVQEQVSETTKEAPQVEQEVQQEEAVAEEKEVKEEKPFELDDQSILSYLKNRHAIEVESIDVLKNTGKQEKQSEPLPEDVAKYLEYRKETGRSFEDFARLQADWTKVDDQVVLREYYAQTKPHLDAEEIDYLISEEFAFDADLDDEKDIKKKKIAYKEELYKARNHFEGLKEKYKAPLESRDVDVPENYKEAFNFYNQYVEESEQAQKLQQERSKVFQENTNSFFGDEFKGFEFKVGEKKQVFKPSDVSKVKQVQSDINNFFNQHLNEDGTVKDIGSYHKALFAAQNADAIFKFAYEQGLADATEGLVKETKNIEMGVRENVKVDSTGTKFRALSTEDDFSFKIRKR